MDAGRSLAVKHGAELGEAFDDITTSQQKAEPTETHSLAPPGSSWLLLAAWRPEDSKYT